MLLVEYGFCLVVLLILVFSHSLTHSLTHSLSSLLSHSLTHSLTFLTSPTHSLTYSHSLVFSPLLTHLGVLVVNVRWRNRNFSGSLIDLQHHKWAPPRYAHVVSNLLC